jgi:hypothetical protein
MKRSSFSLAVVFLLMPAIAQASKRATPQVKYVMAHDAISETVAAERVALQTRAGNIASEMGKALGLAYGDMWFDNTTGRFEVGVVAGAQHADAMPYLESKGIAGQTDFVSVHSSQANLEAAKERLDRKLSGLFSNGVVTTGIDAEDNSVLVRVANNLPEEQIATVQADATDQSVAVTVTPEPPEDVALHPVACQNHTFGGPPNNQVLFCDRSLRGGVTIFDHYNYPHAVCSLGFIATNNTGEYIMTAGHCTTEGNAGWYSAFSDFSESNPSTWAAIGENVGSYMGENGDFGFIKVGTSYSPWYPINAPSSVASLDPYSPWGVNEDQPITEIVWSVQGDGNCHTGGSSDTQCGIVQDTDESATLDGHLVGKLTRDSFCSIAGDSGGTVFGSSLGFGMDDAANVACGEAGAVSLYTEAIRDAYYMGLQFYVPPYGNL